MWRGRYRKLYIYINNETWSTDGGFTFSSTFNTYSITCCDPEYTSMITISIDFPGGTGSYSDDSIHRKCSISYIDTDLYGEYNWDCYSIINITQWDDYIKGTFEARLNGYSSDKTINMSGSINSYLED